MSNPADRPSTDRPTATYPTGRRGRPSGYIRPGDPRLVRADATPTGAFPARRSIRPLGQAARAARPEQETDAATTARTRPSTHAYHAPAQPSTEQAAPAPIEHGQETPIQDMGRPGILRRPTMAWHPSLVQLFVGAVIAIIAFTGIARSATRGMADASARCHQLMATDWSAAERECGARYPGTEPAPAAQAAQPSQTAPAPAAPTSKPAWTVHDTDAPYDRTDPLASPLDLPRCTAAQDTPMPCLAWKSADSTHVTVLEEDASLTGLDRR